MLAATLESQELGAKSSERRASKLGSVLIAVVAWTLSLDLKRRSQVASPYLTRVSKGTAFDVARPERALGFETSFLNST